LGKQPISEKLNQLLVRYTGHVIISPKPEKD